MACNLCETEGGILIWRNARLRVIKVEDENYPGFCRVVWNQHVKEMTDLASTDQIHLMTVVFKVELAIRQILAPDKINLASLGNQVPHLHWHVIPRFNDDVSFPNPIWANPPTLPAAKKGAENHQFPGWPLLHAKRQEKWLPLIPHLQASLEGSI